jgi:hypothetical protein
MRKLIFALLLTTTSPALAGDPLVDFFQGEQQVQKPAFDQAAEACSKGRKATTLAQHDAFIACMEAHPYAANFTLTDKAYMVRMQQTSHAAHNGGDYAELHLQERAWRIAQLQNLEQQVAQAREQRRIANAISDVPLQQATWATIFSTNAYNARPWNPQMYVTHY